MKKYVDLQVCDLLPHRPPMVLIDQLIAFSPDFIHTRVTIHKNSLFYEEGRVPSYISLEYMAQTIGVWNGYSNYRENHDVKIGFLLGTRKLILKKPFFEEGEVLDIFGELKCSIDGMASFGCWVEIDKKCVADATVNVFQPENIDNIHRSNSM